MVNVILSVRCTKTIFKVDGLYLFPRKRIKFEKSYHLSEIVISITELWIEERVLVPNYLKPRI